MRTKLLFVLLLVSFCIHISDAKAGGGRTFLTRSLERWCQAPRWAKGATGGACAMFVYDYYRTRDLEVLDVSRPGNVSVLERGDTDGVTDESLNRSSTRLQLEHDIALNSNPIVWIKRKLSNGDYREVTNAVFLGNFYVFNSNLRERLIRLVLKISKDEAEQNQKDRVSFFHGTNQGAEILLRTIFDEVLNDRTATVPKLRDDEVTTELNAYSSIHGYYNEHYQKSPVTIINWPAALGGGEREKRIYFDHGPARKHMLSVNLGFFGQSSWLAHGMKESSAEFLTSKYSSFYQLGQLLAHGPTELPFLAWLAMLNSREALRDPNTFFDRATKGNEQEAYLKGVFRANGVEELYQNYREELLRLGTSTGAGLVHLMVSGDAARRWSYLALPLGERATSDPNRISEMVSIKNQNSLPWRQGRVLMHPDLLQNSVLRFYLLGKTKDVRQAIDRMYEIAEEIKIYKRH